MSGNRRPIVFVIVTLGVLLLCGSLTPRLPTCAANVVWETDFNGTGFALWHIAYGSFSTSTNALVPTTAPALIMRTCYTAHGTWSFDLFWNGTRADIHLNMDGFMIRFYCAPGGDPYMGLYHYTGGSYHSFVTVESEEVTRYHESWVSVDVTRDVSNDEFMVYLNDTALWGSGEVIQPIYDSITDFAIECTDTTFAFDNAAVSDTVDITPPPSTSIPGFPTAAILLGVVTALGLGFTRRRNKRSPGRTT